MNFLAGRPKRYFKCPKERSASPEELPERSERGPKRLSEVSRDSPRGSKWLPKEDSKRGKTEVTTLAKRLQSCSG